MRLWKGLPGIDKFLVGGAAASIIATSVSLVAEDTRVPITVRGVETLNSPLMPGDDMTVRIYREKVRDCPLVSYRYAVSEDGVRYEFGAEPRSHGGPVGTEYVDVDFRTPHAIPPGQYDFFITAVYTCENKHYVVEHPKTRFRIIPAQGAL
jgi:hypothetical protein